MYDSYRYYLTLSGSTDDVEAFAKRLEECPDVPSELVLNYRATDMKGRSTYKFHVNPDSDPIDAWDTSTEDIAMFALMTPEVEVLLNTVNVNNSLEEYMEIWHHGKYACDSIRLAINTPDEMRKMLKAQP